MNREDSLLISLIDQLLEAKIPVRYRSAMWGTWHDVTGITDVIVDSPADGPDRPKYHGPAWHIDLKNSTGFTITPRDENDWLLSKVDDDYVLHKHNIKPGSYKNEKQVKEGLEDPFIYTLINDRMQDLLNSMADEKIKVQVKATDDITIRHKGGYVGAYVGTLDGIIMTTQNVARGATALKLDKQRVIKLACDRSGTSDEYTILVDADKADDVLTLEMADNGWVITNT